MMRYNGRKAEPEFYVLFYFYREADLFQMHGSKLKMVICTGLASL